MNRSVAALLFTVLLTGNAASMRAQCGGEERWALKVGADTAAANIDWLHPLVTPMHELVQLPRPPLPADDGTRTTAERIVRVVEGRLVKFKEERGKTGDSDFHLVLSDETLLYSAGGGGTTVSPHSVIAEIPDPACVGGRNGTVTAPSHFAAQLAATRAKFTTQFPHITSGWNDASGTSVRVTGVVFFDRDHGQVGRALNGLELHPLLDIEFDPQPLAPTLIASNEIALINPGFELGDSGWSTTTGVITTNPDQAAHAGSGKAWLGGYGTAHTDKLSQDVTLPAGTTAASLSFYLHIETDESKPTSYDRLRVRVRDPNGALLKTLEVFSNLQAEAGYALHSFDLTPWRGQRVRISLEATEDKGSRTSFVIDDVAVVTEHP